MLKFIDHISKFFNIIFCFIEIIFSFHSFLKFKQIKSSDREKLTFVTTISASIFFFSSSSSSAQILSKALMIDLYLIIFRSIIYLSSSHLNISRLYIVGKCIGSRYSSGALGGTPIYFRLIFCRDRSFSCFPVGSSSGSLI